MGSNNVSIDASYLPDKRGYIHSLFIAQPTVKPGHAGTVPKNNSSLSEVFVHLNEKVEMLMGRTREKPQTFNLSRMAVAKEWGRKRPVNIAFAAKTIFRLSKTYI